MLERNVSGLLSIFAYHSLTDVFLSIFSLRRIKFCRNTSLLGTAPETLVLTPSHRDHRRDEVNLGGGEEDHEEEVDGAEEGVVVEVVDLVAKELEGARKRKPGRTRTRRVGGTTIENEVTIRRCREWVAHRLLNCLSRLSRYLHNTIPVQKDVGEM